MQREVFARFDGGEVELTDARTDTLGARAAVPADRIDLVDEDAPSEETLTRSARQSPTKASAAASCLA